MFSWHFFLDKGSAEDGEYFKGLWVIWERKGVKARLEDWGKGGAGRRRRRRYGYRVKYYPAKIMRLRSGIDAGTKKRRRV